MIERLIASAAIAMAMITVVPLSIALGIWIRNKVRKRKADREWMLSELCKLIDRHTKGDGT